MDFDNSLTFSVRKKNTAQNSESIIINPESHSTIIDPTGPIAPRKYAESLATRPSNKKMEANKLADELKDFSDFSQM